MAAEEDECPRVTDDGVDVTLMRWFLSLTPAERVHPRSACAGGAQGGFIVVGGVAAVLQGAPVRNRTYRDLAQHAEEFEVEAGLRVLVLERAK